MISNAYMGTLTTKFMVIDVVGCYDQNCKIYRSYIFIHVRMGEILFHDIILIYNVCRAYKKEWQISCQIKSII